jgi:hypothetical protein
MFWRLLLAHYLGDYPLQPDWMNARKDKIWGLALHISVHWLTAFVLIGPNRLQVWLPVTVLAGVHFFMDWFRTSMTKFWANRKSLAYVIDQMLHVIVIVVIARWIGRILGGGDPFGGERWPIYLIGLLLSTYVWFISERIFAAQNPRYLALLQAQFWSRMIVRGGLFTLLVLVESGFTSGAGMLGFMLPYRSQEFGRKTLIIDLSVAGVTAVVAILVSPAAS